MPVPLLILLYLALAVAPLGLAAALELPRRPLLDEFSSALALAGFALLLAEFLITGRFRPITRSLGTDATMKLHQLIARPLAVLLLHPFLYSLPYNHPTPWDPSRHLSVNPELWPLVAGIAAWILLVVVVLTAIFRDRLPYRYEAWRLSHGLGAALLAALVAFHAIAGGRYSQHDWLARYWLGLLAVAALSLVVVYLLRPLWQLRHPYRVVEVRPAALRTWDVTIAPLRGEAVAFRAGEFVWLTLDRSPFSIREHPFSISSAPAERPRITFTIKQAGDFTGRIGTLAPGTRAYLDGPHGALVLERRRGAGIVFIAGGVGLAPILSMLRQLGKSDERRPLRLLYGNRVREQIIHPEELAELSRQLDLEVVHVLSEPPQGWRGETGIIDAATVQRLCTRDDAADWLYVVCGPPPMIDEVEDALEAIGVPGRQVVSEKFRYS